MKGKSKRAPSRHRLMPWRRTELLWLNQISSCKRSLTLWERLWS